MKLQAFSLILFSIFLSMESIAQPVMASKRESPIGIATYKHHETYIKVTYGKPFKRGRVIFGELVPYGKIWRTGANEATEITSTQDFKFGGKFVRAGTYSLFSIPNTDYWTLILNKEVGQFGAFEYDRTKDLLRIQVPAMKAEQDREDLLIDFGPSGNEKESILFIWWEATKVEVPIGILR